MTIAAMLFACAAVAHAQMPTKDNPACKQPNPVFGKFPGSFTMTCDQSRFAKLEIFQDNEQGRARNRRVEMVLR